MPNHRSQTSQFGPACSPTSGTRPLLGALDGRMEREVFIRVDGEMFYAWEVTFTDAEFRQESRRCTYFERDGKARRAR